MALVRYLLLCVAFTLFRRVLSVQGQDNDKRLSFFAAGDFGGIDVFPFYTYTQKRVAETMGKVGISKNYHS
jgi:hypothetical protein